MTGAAMRRLIVFIIWCAAFGAIVAYMVHEAYDPVTAGKIAEIRTHRYVEQGNKLFEAGRIEEAEASFAAALASDPSLSGRIKRLKLWTRLKVLFDDNDFEAAERLSEDAIAEDRDELLGRAIDVFSFFGADAIRLQRLEKGDRLLRFAVALALEHDAPRPLFRKALDSLQQTSGFDRASQTDPKDAAGYFIRGYAHGAKAEHDLAIADFTKALTLQPKSAIIYKSRGDAYMANGQHDLANADYQRSDGMSRAGRSLRPPPPADPTWQSRDGASP
jgi:hypothetical protein